MSDTVGYILILGLIVLPGVIVATVSERIMLAIFEQQSLLLSFPFP